MQYRDPSATKTQTIACPLYAKLVQDMGISDTIKILGDAGSRIISMPEKERKKYRDALSETCMILQQGIAIPRNKLITILRSNNNKLESERPGDLSKELQDLEFFDWANAEHSIYLSTPLRNVGDEMRGYVTKIKGDIVIRDINELSLLIDDLQKGEQGIARQIREDLESLSALGKDSDLTLQANFENAKKKIREKIDILDNVHLKLIQTELTIREAIKA